MEKYYEIPLTETHHLKHCHLPKAPQNCIEEKNFHIELPRPIFQCYNQVIDLEEYRLPFSTNSGLSNRLQYYKNTHAIKDISMMKKYVKKTEVGKLPFYFVNVADGSFDNCGDTISDYTGGILDCLTFKNHRSCLIWSALKQPLHIVDTNDHDINCHVSLADGGAIYGIKSTRFKRKVFVGVRQKYAVSVFQVSLNENISCLRKLELSSQVAFNDMALNDFKKYEIATIDRSYKLQATDFEENINTKFEMDMGESLKAGIDNFAQIEYIDENTLCCMDRSTLYFVDTRSSSVQEHCLKIKKIDCDELCTFLKSSDFNNLSVMSKHNFARFDIRSMTCVARVPHLLENSPFVSKTISEGDTEYVCLMGESYKDKVMFYNNSKDLNTPRHIPSMIDSYESASLTTKVKHSEYIKSRILLPCVGMQLHKNTDSDEISLYTVNSVGDVFKQNVSANESTNDDQLLNTLSSWIESFPKKPINFKTNNIFDLNHYTKIYNADSIVNESMAEDNSAAFYNDEHHDLVQYLDSNAGLAMNNVWKLQEEMECEFESDKDS